MTNRMQMTVLGNATCRFVTLVENVGWNNLITLHVSEARTVI